MAEIVGGYLKDAPKPWKFRFWPDGPEKRIIQVRSVVFPIGMCIGSSGHHHATVEEVKNEVWDASCNGWRTFWEPEGYSQERQDHIRYIGGRKEENTNFVHASDVREWALEIISKWKATESTHVIHWELAKDDPMAKDPTVTDMLRTRIEGQAGL